LNAGVFVDGLLGDERRKTGWMRAGGSGRSWPWAAAGGLGRDRWGCRCTARTWCAIMPPSILRDENAVLVIDETGFLQARQGIMRGSAAIHWCRRAKLRTVRMGLSAPPRRSQRRSDDLTGGVLSAGAGTKGPRFARLVPYLEWADLEGEESNHHSQVLWTRGLLIRRNIANGDLALLHHLVSGRDFDQDPGQRRGPSLGDRG